MCDFPRRHALHGSHTLCGYVTISLGWRKCGNLHQSLLRVMLKGRLFYNANEQSNLVSLMVWFHTNFREVFKLFPRYKFRWKYLTEVLNEIQICYL